MFLLSKEHRIYMSVMMCVRRPQNFLWVRSPETVRFRAVDLYIPSQNQTRYLRL